ncbi:MAG: SLC13 family permease [Chloroflexota bacterium]|nr:SLC13 family permease [Chloroflexota bacterium]
MTGEIVFVLVVVGVAVVVLASGRVPFEVTAIAVLLALFFGRAIDFEAALRGFSNSAVVTIGAVMVMSAGLANTGVAHWMGRLIGRLAGNSEARLIAFTVLAAALLSGFMNAIAAGGVLLPAAVAAARELKIPISRVLLPLSYATLLGSVLTLVGTPSNLLVNSVVAREGIEPFGLLDFTPFGAAILVAGVLALVFGRHRLLPRHASGAAGDALLPRAREDHVPYRLEERLYEVAIPPVSPLVGLTLRESGIRTDFGISIVAIQRQGGTDIAPAPEVVLHAGEVLVMSARDRDITRLRERFALPEPRPSTLGAAALQTENVEFAEASLAPRSTLVGETVPSLNFRDRYGLSVLGIWRDGAPRRTHLHDMPLRVGDALLVLGPLPRIAELRDDPDFVVVTERVGLTLRPRQAPIAVAIVAGFVAALLLQLAPVAIVALAAAAAMVVTGCVRGRETLAAVDWRAIVVIGGMLTLAEAMRQSGAAALVGESLAESLGDGGPWIVLASMLLLTAMFTHVLGNHVTAVLMAPVALSAAALVGADPRMFAMGVALAASTGFITAYAHPVNLLVMGPGNFRPRDYARAGIPIALLVLLVDFGMLALMFGAGGS